MNKYIVLFKLKNKIKGYNEDYLPAHIKFSYQ